MDKGEMDRGIWATWYDLPEQGKEEYIAWLHEVHLPKALLRPGYLWAAHIENIWDEARKAHISKRLIHTDDPTVPTGNAYIILYGAASPHVFLKPRPAQLEAQRTAEERDMFGLRVGVRSCIFLETDRMDGPDVGTRAPNGAPGPAVEFGSYNLTKEIDDETVMDMYAKIRFPHLAKMAGFVAIRKMVSVYGWARHGVLYEVASKEALEKDFLTYMEQMPNRELWRQRLVRNLIHTPGSPSLGMRIWPTVSQSI